MRRCHFRYFFLLLPRPPRSTLFPYTTLFRSAFKEVEVAVRTAGGFQPTDIGVDLMSKAFKVDNGPLTTLKALLDRKSTRLNSSHPSISYAVFCLKKKRSTP